jgi:molybdopterin synthase catalytic subunit
MHFALTRSELELVPNLNRVQDPTCGAISSFIGTVRNSFEGKTVLFLEYSAYERMANIEMQKIFHESCINFPRVKHISVEHRLGVVEAGCASVLIFCSAPDRASALECTRFIIEQIKARLPIWKKEVGEGWESWKKNTEWQAP